MIIWVKIKYVNRQQEETIRGFVFLYINLVVYKVLALQSDSYKKITVCNNFMHYNKNHQENTQVYSSSINGRVAGSSRTWIWQWYASIHAATFELRVPLCDITQSYVYAPLQKELFHAPTH